MLAVAGVLLGVHINLRFNYVQWIVRIFQEKPLFVIPRGLPIPDAEDIRFRTEDGVELAGCYLHGHGLRRGVILFGLEFGSNRWSCVPYCEHLIDEGYDVFAFELRGQGDSACQPGYHPLQWVTEHEVRDTRAAVAYLKSRSDADPRGIGFFGISKGAGAGLEVAAVDPYIRCCVTDGVFATYTTLVPYMRQWYRIYQTAPRQALFPSWFYGIHGLIALRRLERLRFCRFVHLERALPRVAPRPVLMIHGGDDTYIKPEIARTLFELAREPRELWIVEGAKHNQALQVAGDEYRRRLLYFFNTHLGGTRALQDTSPAQPARQANGQAPALNTAAPSAAALVPGIDRA
jgi:pimeloyl-ACP methyl ester carboxylesterase